MRKRQIELDFIRGIAILMVLDYHFRATSIFFAPLAALGFPHFGWAGVDLFFILSGFLVGGLLLDEWKRTGNFDAVRFLKRRALKIWPAFYFFLAVEAIVRVHPLKTFLLGNILSIQNYTVNSIPHTWSLAIEEQFYLFLILIMVVSSKSRQAPRWIFGIGMSSGLIILITRTVLNFAGFETYKYTHTRADALLWGLLLAVLYHFSPDRLRRIQNQRVILITVLGAAIGGLYLAESSLISKFAVTIADIGCLALFLLLYRTSEDHSFAYRVVAKCGTYSYGIYLWHLSVRTPVSMLAEHVPTSMRWSINHLLPYLSAITLGILTTKLIEVPFLRLRERILPAATPSVSHTYVPAESVKEQNAVNVQAIA
jgi:peptidoglycan/LPS O-acetylase OafA/YrhL